MSKALKLLKTEELRKKYRGFSVNAQSSRDTDMEVRLRIPSRVLWCNHQIGGGLPYGKMIEIFGYESTGKTLLALDYAYGAQALGGVVLFADAERAADSNWMVKNGLDLSRVELLNYNGLEIFSDWLKDTVLYYRSQLVKNEPILIIYDSIAAADTEENIGADQSNQKGTYGMNRSKAWNEFYRKRIDFLARYGATLIMLNQVRPKIGATMYEAQEQTPGGASHKFYASIRLALSRGGALKYKFDKKKSIWVPNKDDGKKIGQKVFIANPKNKTYPPGERVESQVYFRDFRYDYVGYNRYQGLDTLLVDAGILKIKKDGNAKAYYLDGVPIIRKLDTFSDELHTNAALRKKLIKAGKINTISKTQSKIDALTKNMYPVKVKNDE